MQPDWPLGDARARGLRYNIFELLIVGAKKRFFEIINTRAAVVGDVADAAQREFFDNARERRDRNSDDSGQ